MMRPVGAIFIGNKAFFSALGLPSLRSRTLLRNVEPPLRGKVCFLMIQKTQDANASCRALHWEPFFILKIKWLRRLGSNQEPSG